MKFTEQILNNLVSQRDQLKIEAEKYGFSITYKKKGTLETILNWEIKIYSEKLNDIIKRKLKEEDDYLINEIKTFNQKTKNKFTLEVFKKDYNINDELLNIYM
jgi:phage-related tail protein